MLTERKHIALLGAVATLVFPAAASAARHDQMPPRVRLRADAPSPIRSGAIGLGDAKAVSGPLLDPVERFSHLLAMTTTTTEHLELVHARKRRAAHQARAEEEQFAQLPGGVSIGTLETIASCESGGNPEAVSPEGTYRGLFQFDQGTWESVGGTGDPAQAPAAEQEYRAALLYSESGSSPWPVCG